MADIVYAVATAAVVNPLTEEVVNLNVGDVWAADDPFVKAVPHMFSAEPTRIRRTVRQRTSGVEQATAAPGEKRRKV
ncbi:MAG TPA: hypothetical protein VF377_03945 [Acidimicrobiia bacterium]|jgi:hypothetical protein|nr:hypothetical protein [Glycomyces sp.]